MPAIDPFDDYSRSKDRPYDNIFVVNPSDTDDLPYISSFMHISDPLIYEQQADGSAKAKELIVKITTAGNDVITLGVYGGYKLDIVRIKKVWATGTTATKLLAYY